MSTTISTRFDGNATPLTRDQIAIAAPSVFATRPHPAVSSKYCFVPTYEVVQQLEGEGFFPIHARQSRARTTEGYQFVAHSVRFRHKSSFDGGLYVGKEIAEVILTGSHDRSSTLQFSAGVFRTVCENGMIVNEKNESMTFRHIGGVDLSRRLIEAVVLASSEAQAAVNRANQWKGIALPVAKQLELARRVIEVKGETRFSPGRILEAQRPEDYAAEDGTRDLWTTFNVIQEHLVRGGVPYTSQTGRQLKTRPVRSVLGDLNLNRSLWAVASEFALSV